MVVRFLTPSLDVFSSLSDYVYNLKMWESRVTAEGRRGLAGAAAQPLIS